MHVRISDRGWDILDNKELATKIVRSIMDGKKELESGRPITLKDENVSVEMVTSLIEEETKSKEHKT